MSAPSGFLEPADVRKLTGRPQKSRQIEFLRAEGIPFHVNVLGHPVVTWAAVEGRRPAASEAEPWRPRAMQGA